MLGKKQEVALKLTSDSDTRWARLFAAWIILKKKALINNGERRGWERLIARHREKKFTGKPRMISFAFWRNGWADAQRINAADS